MKRSEAMLLLRSSVKMRRRLRELIVSDAKEEGRIVFDEQADVGAECADKQRS